MSNTAVVTLRPDSKGRITLGQRTAGISGYKLTDLGDGNLMLTAMAEIPAREHWIFKNPKALASLNRGLEDVAAGRVVSRGSFAKYLEE